MPHTKEQVNHHRDYPCGDHCPAVDATSAAGRDGNGNPILEAALSYCARGWRVIPLHSLQPDGQCTCGKGKECGRSTAKHPRISKWQHQASADEALVRRWWMTWPTANVGIGCGPESGIWVLDLDGPEGFEVLAGLCAEHGDIPPTPVAQTGSGGWHYYFAWPTDGGLSPKTQAKLHGQPIDVRAGGGSAGQVVAPPSWNASGEYRWLIAPEVAPPGQAPGWLLEWVRSWITREQNRQPNPQPTPRPTFQGGADVVERSRRYLQRCPLAVSGQGGHGVTLWAARAVVYGFDLGVERGLELLLSEYNPRCSPPWSERDLRHKCEEADRVPFHRPRGYLRDQAPERRPGPPPGTSSRGGDGAAEIPPVEDQQDLKEQLCQAADELIAELGDRPSGDADAKEWAENLARRAVAGARSLPGTPQLLADYFLRPLAIRAEMRVERLASRAWGHAVAMDLPPDRLPPTSRLVTQSLAEVRLQPVRWLVPDLIPAGKLTLLAGDGGLGKSSVTIDLAAALSMGRPAWGLEYDPRDGPADTLFISCEDDAADTVLPRFLAAGGSRDRVHLLQGRRDEKGEALPFSLLHVHDLLSHLESRPSTRLVIIDPVSAYVGGAKVDEHKDSDLRALLGPLTDAAARTGVSFVLVKHMNKATGGKAIHRIAGSVAYVNAVRQVLAVAADPEDDDRRFLMPVKANLTREKRALAYHLEQLNDHEADVALFGACEHLTESDRDAVVKQLYRIRWEGFVEVSADEVMGSGGAKTSKSSTKVEQCSNWIEAGLQGLAWPDAEVLEAAERSGFTKDNYRRGKTLLKARGLTSATLSFRGPWWLGMGKVDTWTHRPPGMAWQSPAPVLGPVLGTDPHSPETPKSPETPETGPSSLT